MGETITPQELAAMLQSKSATVCDVRREADYQADQRTIAGAQWHNPEHVDQWAAQRQGQTRCHLLRARRIGEQVCACGVDRQGL